MTVPPEAAEAAAKVVMRGGSIADALEAAEPLMLAAERERLRHVPVRHRGRPPLDGRYRQHAVRVSLSPAEKALLKAEADRRGMAMVSLLRETFLESMGAP